MPSKSKVTSSLKLKSYDELFPEANDSGSAQEVYIKELHDFKDHPFHVRGTQPRSITSSSICLRHFLMHRQQSPDTTGRR